MEMDEWRKEVQGHIISGRNVQSRGQTFCTNLVGKINASTLKLQTYVFAFFLDVIKYIQVPYS